MRCQWNLDLAQFGSLTNWAWTSRGPGCGLCVLRTWSIKMRCVTCLLIHPISDFGFNFNVLMFFIWEIMSSQLWNTDNTMIYWICFHPKARVSRGIQMSWRDRSSSSQRWLWTRRAIEPRGDMFTLLNWWGPSLYICNRVTTGHPTTMVNSWMANLNMPHITPGDLWGGHRSPQRSIDSGVAKDAIVPGGRCWGEYFDKGVPIFWVKGLLPLHI